MERVDEQVDNSKPASEALVPVPSVPLTDDTDLVESELLIEEISIDGMCGVY